MEPPKVKRIFYIKLLGLSLIGTLTISLISLICLVRLSDLVAEDYRYGYLLYLGRAIEKSSTININEVQNHPLLEKKSLSLFKLTEFGPSHQLSKPNLWVVTSQGKILSSNSPKPLPANWNDLPHPKQVHGFESKKHSLFSPKTFILKLDTAPASFLVSHNKQTLFQGPFLWIQGTHAFTTAMFAVLLALSLIFYYLRRKSFEAKIVLSKLEAGDLKARFEVRRYDQFGNLILDFNRMADEIERLVKRLKDTETSRSNLLQELGHDLRTPLTSLNTSLETLQHYSTRLTEEERQEVFLMSKEDIRYFNDLLEKLMVIASIEGPHYKEVREEIDLYLLLEQELRARQNIRPDLNWDLQLKTHSHFIFGDPHLITRLFKNAFDNAARYAQSTVQIKISLTTNHLEVYVLDDGPGLTHESLLNFGKRREQREKKLDHEGHYSLGLGSVIMKTIAEVHGGHIEINNRSEQTGAQLKIIFKKSDFNFTNHLGAKMTRRNLSQKDGPLNLVPKS